MFQVNITDSNTAFLAGRTVVQQSAHAAHDTLAFRATLPRDLALWHRRTMHLHLAGLERAIRHKLVTGVTLETREHVPTPFANRVSQGRCTPSRLP